VLREIAGHCVEETGGLFVQRPEDSDDYFREKLEGCRECGIPARVLSGAEAREVEPHLAADVKRAIEVPDGAVDPFRLCVANAIDAETHGARIETHAEVVDLLRDGDDIYGVEVRHDSGPGKRTHATPGTTEEITADYVVNATGAWAGQIGAMAGIEVEVRPSKGVMTIMNVRQVDTVINRCRPKGDADIVVPHETTAILGTTDEEVSDPDDYPEAGWEVDQMIDTLSELVPILEEARTVRSFWGVRPLYEPPGTGTEDPTDITRDFFLLDHADRDGVSGMSSIVGGKFTTYRAMAEEISDHVCEKLGVTAACTTAEEPCPAARTSKRSRQAWTTSDCARRWPAGASNGWEAERVTYSRRTSRTRCSASARGDARGDSRRGLAVGLGSERGSDPDASLDGELSGRLLLSEYGERTPPRVRRGDGPRGAGRPLSGALEGRASRAVGRTALAGDAQLRAARDDDEQGPRSRQRGRGYGSGRFRGLRRRSDRGDRVDSSRGVR